MRILSIYILFTFLPFSVYSQGLVQKPNVVCGDIQIAQIFEDGSLEWTDFNQVEKFEIYEASTNLDIAPIWKAKTYLPGQEEPIESQFAGVSLIDNFDNFGLSKKEIVRLISGDSKGKISGYINYPIDTKGDVKVELFEILSTDDSGNISTAGSLFSFAVQNSTHLIGTCNNFSADTGIHFLYDINLL